MHPDHSFILSLSDPAATPPRVGPKAARLATLHQAGYAVPDAFVLTVAAFQQGMSEAVRQALYTAYRDLQATGATTVAVRSSAIAEDTDSASYAGMQATVLGVRDEAALETAVQTVWESYHASHAAAYRARAQGADGGMAVLIQRQIAPTVAGVAFARDPLTGEHATIIEAVEGLGEALVSGTAEPHRWRVRGNTNIEALSRPDSTHDLLSHIVLREIAVQVAALEGLFAAPQDVEWAYDGAQLWLLQSRPITTLQTDWFSEVSAEDTHMWGAAFLNERFTLPVSPLGWTLVAEPLEQLAFRAPLALLGGTGITPPLLKLWQGHPYSRVEAWQKMYKLFPDWLLPDDAERFFPNGDTSLRHAPRQPVYGLHLIVNALGVLRHNWKATSPWENPKGWAAYERKQSAALLRLDFQARQLPDTADPITAGRAILREGRALTDELLEYHRWSLLYADVLYSLLRRWLTLRHGAEEGARQLVALTTQVESPTTRMNRALNQLVAQMDGVRDEVLAVAEGAPLPTTGVFWEQVAHFLRDYGHRFMSLDIYDPPWQADPAAFAALLLTLRPAPDPTPHPAPRGWLIHLTREYLHLREAQRFYWQRIMALQRRVVVQLGVWWHTQGLLKQPNDVFGLTWTELLHESPNGEVVATRMARLHQLRREAALSPAWHYPDFLRGNTPLMATRHESHLQGRAVSPGVARGRARLVTSPADVARVQAGEILVTFAPDPGWTPLFGIVAGMVTERGGQLSHGAVVAREYQLPAVSGIAGLLATIQEGEWLLVDGTKGIVVRDA